jgi:hypothetical protein
MRKLWHKPELIVLVRGTADERVLQGCKGTGAYDSGPGTPYDTPGTFPCWSNGDYCGDCKSVG